MLAPSVSEAFGARLAAAAFFASGLRDNDRAGTRGGNSAVKGRSISGVLGTADVYTSIGPARYAARPA